MDFVARRWMLWRCGRRNEAPCSAIHARRHSRFCRPVVPPSKRRAGRLRNVRLDRAVSRTCPRPASSRGSERPPPPRNGLRMDSDYPVTRQHAVVRSSVSSAKTAAIRPKGATGRCATVVGDVGIEPTAASASGPAHRSRPLARRLKSLHTGAPPTHCRRGTDRRCTEQVHSRQLFRAFGAPPGVVCLLPRAMLLLS